MSLRRRTCDACYRSRRKCDLIYPTCGTCLRTNKTCRYAYAPVRSSRGRAMSDVSEWPTDLTVTTDSPATFDTSLATLMGSFGNTTPRTPSGAGSSDFSFDLYEGLSEYGGTPSLEKYITKSTSIGLRLVGPLGEAQPVEGSSESWQWIMDEIKSYPREFAQRAETLFIHKQLYHDSMPKSIRTAFSVSSAYSLLNENNRAMIFRVVDAEVTELLQASGNKISLLDELARVQALALYQIMRLFQGNIEQRMLAEQQQGTLMGAALNLLVRSQTELHDLERVCWYSWILADCIRRTAFLVYMLYGVNSIFRQGICIGFHTLAKLPLSTALSSWNSEADHRNHPEPENTISYEMFTEEWLAMPRKLDPFEKFLLVPCRGIGSLAAYDDSQVFLPTS